MPCALAKAAFLVALAAPTRGACPEASVRHDVLYGAPEAGCCSLAGHGSILCDPSGETPRDEAHAKEQCARLAASTLVNTSGLANSWQTCKESCDADPICNFWSSQPAHRRADGGWMPSVCRLLAEPLQCTPAFCVFAGAASGQKDCGAAVVRRLNETSLGLRVRSAGYSDGNYAAFYVNGARLSLVTHTGFNIVVLRSNGTVEAFESFNTHAVNGSREMVTFINGLASGTIVLIAVRDEAAYVLTSDARQALRRCGATQAHNITYRSSYALAGIVDGAAIAEAVHPENGGPVEANGQYTPAAPVNTSTGVVSIRVKSEGYTGTTSGLAEFYLGEQRLSVPSGRGMNVVVLSHDGAMNSSHIFDTHGNSGSAPMAAFLNGLEMGTPVLIAAKDDAKPGLTSAAVEAIEGCGATLISGLHYRYAYALIGIRGGQKLAEMVLPEGDGVAQVSAQYDPFATTTTTTTTTTTSTPAPDPMCDDFSCPSGKMMRLDAWNVTGSDASTCCEDSIDGVVSVMVKSAGWGNGNTAEFFVEGDRLSVRTGRGMNVVVLREDGSMVRSGDLQPQVFDTHSRGAAENMTAFLDGLENGTRVLVAVKDEANTRLTSGARAALERCGATQIRNLHYRGAYALIGVKGGAALAEELRADHHGMAVAIARAAVTEDEAAATARPVCNARASNPPVRGWVSNGQLELEAGCRYQLWEGENAATCLQGSWMAVIGGSNTVLMGIRLANMLAPEAIMPVRDGATMGGFTVVDVIITNGAVTYNNSQKIDGCTALPYDAACKSAIASMVAAAPAYSSSPGSTRVTLFEARFWDHADVAMDTLIADTNWVGAPMALLMQVSTWYIYCASMKLSWCPRTELIRPELSHAQALELFKTDMAPVVSKLETLCVQGGRAASHGCVVATTSWQNPSPSRLHFYNDYNAAIVSALAGKTSDILRIVDLWTLGQAFPDENILGHGSPFLNLWNWQVFLGGMCPPEDAAEGTYAEFEGALCYGSEARRVKVSTNPDRYDLAPATGSRCPAYWDACPSQGGNHLRCEPWECANSVPCRLVAVVREQAWVEANLSGACYNNITCSFASAAAEEEEAPCRRVWCDDSLEWVPAVVALSLVILMFGGSKLWARFAPERLRRALGPAEDPKKKPAATPRPAAAEGEAKPAAEKEAAKPDASGAAPALLLTLQADSTEGGEKAKEQKASEGLAPQAVAVAIKDEPASSAEPPKASGGEAAAAAAAAKPAAPAAAKPKGAGDKFPLGLARMCASMHVVVGHLYAKSGVVPNVYFFGWGFTWVPWFFMLSGFVLFTAHLRRPKEEGVFEYVMRRSVTIYPLYAVSLVPAFAIAESLDISPKAIILVAQSWLLQAWVPAWTENALQMHCWFLSAMVVYWFLFKPLSRCLRGISLRVTVALMAGLFFLPWLVVLIPALADQSVVWYKQHSGGSTDTWLDLSVVFLKFHPACYLHVFVLGMLLAKLRLLLDAKAVAAGMPLRWRLPLEFVAPAGYFGLFLIFALPALQPWGYKLSARLSVLLPFQAAILFGLAGLPSLPRGRMASVFSRLDFLENYSYAVYVFQFICYSVWPKKGRISLPLFLIFLTMTAVFVVHTVQRPVQRWWSKHPRARWGIPICLSLALGGLKMLLPTPEANPDLPALVRHDSHMVDVRLPLTDSDAAGGRLMNPSLLLRDGQVMIAARRHRLETTQRNDDGSCSRYNATACTIIDQTWYSQIAIGTAAFDEVAWAQWPATGAAPFQASLSSWAALRTPEATPWTNLCVMETYIQENNTLIRHVVTGPEDPKLVGLAGGATGVVFDSLPPRGADGCPADEGLAPVSQMYMARYGGGVGGDIGHRLDYGSTTEDEKNWIAFTNETGQLFFAYHPLPHDIIACQTDGVCEDRYSSNFQPLQQFQRDNPGLAEWRGSAQAMLISGEERRTPNLPRRHYLGLLHAVETSSKRYAHFAYRFTAEPPYAILQVSSQLPLQSARSDSRAVPFAFASGLAVRNGTVAISYGAGDRDARALVLTLERLDEFFACNASSQHTSNSSLVAR